MEDLCYLKDIQGATTRPAARFWFDRICFVAQESGGSRVLGRRVSQLAHQVLHFAQQLCEIQVPTSCWPMTAFFHSNSIQFLTADEQGSETEAQYLSIWHLNPFDAR
jgi:hypothetical protein